MHPRCQIPSRCNVRRYISIQRTSSVNASERHKAIRDASRNPDSARQTLIPSVFTSFQNLRYALGSIPGNTLGGSEKVNCPGVVAAADAEAGKQIAGPFTPLRPEFVTCLSCVVVYGWKAPKSICKQAWPGLPRLRLGQAFRLRVTKLSVCDRSAKRFAQDDGSAGGLNITGSICRKHEKIETVTGSRDGN
jgi:hypothetical protein